jgi:tetrahydromethanopterin S-methyltransferase subunit B
MAPILVTPFSNLNKTSPVVGNTLPGREPNSLDASQIQNMVFGVISAVFAFISLVFAALQVYQMRRLGQPLSAEQELAEMGHC